MQGVSKAFKARLAHQDHLDLKEILAHKAFEEKLVPMVRRVRLEALARKERTALKVSRVIPVALALRASKE